MDTLELGYALGVTALGRRYISTSEICAMPGTPKIQPAHAGCFQIFIAIIVMPDTTNGTMTIFLEALSLNSVLT